MEYKNKIIDLPVYSVCIHSNEPADCLNLNFLARVKTGGFFFFFYHGKIKGEALYLMRPDGPGYCSVTGEIL